MTNEQFVERVLEAEAGMYRVARSILHNEEDCADAAQNAILKAFDKLDTLKHEKYFKTWLTRILINECFRILEKRKSEVSYEEYMIYEGKGSMISEVSHADAWDDVSHAHENTGLYVSGSDTGSGVFDAICSLDAKYRVPFVLHYVEGYSVKELSGMLGLGTSNVKVRLSRARAMLRDILEGEAI